MPPLLKINIVSALHVYYWCCFVFNVIVYCYYYCKCQGVWRVVPPNSKNKYSMYIAFGVRLTKSSVYSFNASLVLWINCQANEGNVLFNDALKTFYIIRLYGIINMVKDQSWNTGWNNK